MQILNVQNVTGSGNKGKKQEKHYRNHKTSCYIKFPELPLTVLDESRAEYNCTNCGCVFPLKNETCRNRVSCL